ncbi:MAG: DUF2306 domain-containing protein [Flavobacteriales bacterium]|nr:DUF2306 domain-containing protein [Flavobacteriales bacterium]
MKRTNYRLVWKWLGYAVLLLFCGLMLRIILPYWSFQTNIGFLRIKQHYLHITPWKVAFFIHALGAVLSLPAGFTQFSDSFRRKRTKWHQRLGKTYLVAVLGIGAPTGLILAWYANGRLPSQIGFTLLAILWFWFTWMAWKSIVYKEIKQHQNWMIRSYALTLSAITLRLWKYVLANTLAPDPLLLYQVVTWLGFVPNLLVAEWLIRTSLFRKSKKKLNVVSSSRHQT